MFELFCWPKPSGKRVAILLEEPGAEYRITLVDIGRGDRLKPDSLG